MSLKLCVWLAVAKSPALADAAVPNVGLLSIKLSPDTEFQSALTLDSPVVLIVGFSGSPEIVIPVPAIRLLTPPAVDEITAHWLLLLNTPEALAISRSPSFSSGSVPKRKLYVQSAVAA